MGDGVEGDSWGRRRWEEDGYYGGGWKGEKAGAKSVPKGPDVVGGEVREEEGGLDFGAGLDLRVVVSVCAILQYSSIRVLDEVI
jgi:hypothetical protein